MEQKDDKEILGESYISAPFHQDITQKEKTCSLWRPTVTYCPNKADSLKATQIINGVVHDQHLT